MPGFVNKEAKIEQRFNKFSENWSKMRRRSLKDSKIRVNDEEREREIKREKERKREREIERER